MAGYNANQRHLIKIQALVTLAKEQAENEDIDNLKALLDVLHEEVFEMEVK